MKWFHLRVLIFTAYQTASSALRAGWARRARPASAGGSSVPPLQAPRARARAFLSHRHTFSSLCLCTWSSSDWRSPCRATKPLRRQIQISTLLFPTWRRAPLIRPQRALGLTSLMPSNTINVVLSAGMSFTYLPTTQTRGYGLCLDLFSSSHPQVFGCSGGLKHMLLNK